MPVIPNSLNDAVALLIQLEVTDTGDLALLRDALSAMGPEQGVSGEARPVVESAAHLLTAIIDGSAADPEADLALVSQALDEALNTLAPVTETVPSVDALTPPRKSRARSAKKPASPSETVSGPSGARQTPGTRNDDRADARVVSSSASSMAESLPSPTAAALSTDRLPPGSDRLLLRDFVNESAEYLAEAESALLALEANPHDAEAVNTVFRGFHTVKGTASVLGLPLIADFAHEAESLLMRVRDREFSFGPQCADLSLRSVDMLKLLLGVVEAALSGDGQLLPPSGYHSLMVAIDGYNPSADILAVETAMAGEPAARAGHLDLAHDATIRVRTDRLDRLINMVGELVIAQTMIAGDRHLSVGDSSELSRKVSHAGKIVRELQELSMSMRMVPLRSTFQKMARVVRDTASKVGKSVQFTTEGDDVEIDRNLVDLLADPLVHMVRNAVDHGIESPDGRDRAGKSRTGSVRLHAYHASGNVVVELIDDGGGLHRDRIVAKAIEKGLIESDRGMSDNEVFNLIFAPGFSTAEKVTDISGRGVGLDVVRRNLEMIRGTLEISSTPGVGATFSIRLPLTLAVTDGMLVRVGAERFVIPMTQIHMSFRPEAPMLSTVVGQGEMVLLRGSLMPLVRLHRLFSVTDAIENPLTALLVIVGDGAQRTALMVDELLGQQQVVAKPLGDGLGRVPGFSGGAILGDGRVGLILDVRETMSLTTFPATSTLKLAS